VLALLWPHHPATPATPLLHPFPLISTFATLAPCSCSSLSVSAEPFGSPPQPVPLDLLDLPPGLTSLELRNIDVTSHPADLMEAAAAQAAADFTTVPVAAGAACFAAPHVAQGPPCPLQQQQQGVGCGVQGVCSSGASRCDGGSSGEAGGPGGSSGGGPRAVLQHLERFQLESCRLRAPQLQVGPLVVTG